MDLDHDKNHALSEDSSVDSEKTNENPFSKIVYHEPTRLIRIEDIIFDDDQSPLDKEFPILPMSKESLDAYKKIKDSLRVDLSEEEQNILFGSDSSDEDISTIKASLSKSISSSFDEKIRNVDVNKFILAADSISEEKRKQAVEHSSMDVLKEIVESAMKKEVNENKGQQDSNLFFEPLKLTMESEPILSGHEKENDIEGSDFDVFTDGSESVSSETPPFLHEEEIFQDEKSSKSSKSSDELVQKNYLKPEDVERSIKARFDTGHIKEVNLIEKLDKDDLKELKGYFFPQDVDHEKVIMKYGLKNGAHYNGIPFKKRHFMEAIDNIIGAKEYTLAAGRLFEQLENNKVLEEGVIWWEQFLDVIIKSKKSSDLSSPSAIFDEVPTQFEAFSKSPIIKIIKVTSNGQTIYVTLARLGQIAILDEELKIVHSYKVPINQHRLKKCCWLTDACFSPETETLFIIASTRSLYLYNTSRIAHKLIQTISGMWDIPECIHFTKMKKTEALILMGDYSGSIITYHFKQINKSFFKVGLNKNGGECYSWKEITEQSEWVDVSTVRYVHGDVVLQVEYILKSDCIISCSLDSKISIAVRYRQPNRVPYIFTVEKGVKCFRLDQFLGVLATISGDTVVSLWDPINTSRPLGELKGHTDPVLDVSLIRNGRLAVTFAENKELRVWDIETFSCLQKMIISFKDVIYSKHLLLNVRAIFLDFQQQYDKSQSQSSSSKISINEGDNYFRKFEIVKKILIINFNNIKMLNISYSNDDINTYEQDFEKINSEKNEVEEDNPELEMLSFINKISSREEKKHKYKHPEENKALVEFVKEGTPYLALKLQETINIA